MIREQEQRAAEGETDFITSADGLRLHVSRWLPDGAPRAILVLVHGFTEHADRYAELAARLNRHGYAVYAADLRGHGRSEGEPILVMDFDQYVDDLARLLEYVGQREAGRPLFLFGHSMGGTIVALLAAKRQPDARGFVLSAPGLAIDPNVHPYLRRIAHVVGRWFPRLRVVRLGSGSLSRDEAVVQHFRSDPLVYHGRLPARTGSEILRAADRARQGAPNVQRPLLILHGTGDRLTTVAASRDFCAAAATPDKRLQLYEGLYHDLVHEPEKEQVMDDLVAWLDQRVKNGA